MRTIQFFIIAILIHNDLPLHGQWTIQNYEGYSRFNNIKFASDSEGFMIGDHSLILKTIDGGNTWNSIDAGADIFFQDFQLIDKSTIIGSGFHYEGAGNNMQSKVLKSSDYGNTWEVISTLPGNQFYSQWFFDEQVGLLSGYKGILKTNDGGDSWESVFNKTTEDIFFINDSVGYTHLFESGELMRTENQGISWEQIWTFNSMIKNIHFVNDSLGFIGTYGQVFRTDNAGLSWQAIEIEPYQTVLSIDFISEGIGFMISSEICPCILEKSNFYTSVSKTVDSGLTWESFTYPGTLFSVDFIDEHLGYVSGEDNLIMKFSGGDLSALPLEYPWRFVNSAQKSHRNNVYPNPVTDKLTIEVSRPSELPKIQLFSSEGKLIGFEQIKLDNQIRLDFNHLPKGIYFLHISHANQTQKFKIVKAE